MVDTNDQWIRERTGRYRRRRIGNGRNYEYIPIWRLEAAKSYEMAKGYCRGYRLDVSSVP